MKNNARKLLAIILAIIITLFNAIAILLTCCACHGTNSSSNQSSSSTPTAQHLNEILTEEEQERCLNYIDSIELKWQRNNANVVYLENAEGFNKLYKIGIKGVPVLMFKAISIESIRGDLSLENANGYEFSWYLMFATNNIFRVDHNDFLTPNRGAVRPSRNYYTYWKYAKDELNKIAVSDMEHKDKITQYVKFGIFAVPYVKEEIKKGNAEYEKFFALIGAHQSTTDYMITLGHTQSVYEKPTTQEEIEKSLLESSTDFDYNQWLAENEEDINNLIEFLDEYVKEYESKAGTE